MFTQKWSRVQDWSRGQSAQGVDNIHVRGCDLERNVQIINIHIYLSMPSLRKQHVPEYEHSIGVRSRQMTYFHVGKLLCAHTLSFVKQQIMFMHPTEIFGMYVVLYFSNITQCGARAGTLGVSSRQREPRG